MRKHLLLLAFMTASLVASAQTAGSGKTTTANNDTWSSVRISYNHMSLDGLARIALLMFEEPDDLTRFNGLSGEFRTNFNIVEGKPIFLETGLGFSFVSSKYKDSGDGEKYYEYYDDNYYNEEYGYYGEYVDGYAKYTYEEKTKINFMSLYVPINVAYKFSINDQMSIMPYLGLKARFNVSANTSEEYIRDYSEYYEDVNEKEKYSLFDKEIMEGEIMYAKRFQLGWQIGADLQFNKFLVGLSYGSDISEVMTATKFKTTQISLGYIF